MPPSSFQVMLWVLLVFFLTWVFPKWTLSWLQLLVLTSDLLFGTLWIICVLFCCLFFISLRLILFLIMSKHVCLSVDMYTCELRCPRVQTRVSVPPGAAGGPGSSTGTACVVLLTDELSLQPLLFMFSVCFCTVLLSVIIKRFRGAYMLFLILPLAWKVLFILFQCDILGISSVKHLLLIYNNLSSPFNHFPKRVFQR